MRRVVGPKSDLFYTSTDEDSSSDENDETNEKSVNDDLEVLSNRPRLKFDSESDDESGKTMVADKNDKEDGEITDDSEPELLNQNTGATKVLFRFVSLFYKLMS